MGARTKPITLAQYRALLRLLRRDVPYIELAVRMSADTGLRVSDVLRIEVGQLRRTMDIIERKTGKERRVKLADATYRLARKLGEGRGFTERLIPCDRATVFRHLTKAARRLGLEHVSMHSLRKYYARRFAKRRGIEAAQQELCHKYLSTTLLYLVDEDLLKKVL